MGENLCENVYTLEEHFSEGRSACVTLQKTYGKPSFSRQRHWQVSAASVQATLKGHDPGPEYCSIVGLRTAVLLDETQDKISLQSTSKPSKC